MEREGTDRGGKQPLHRVPVLETQMLKESAEKTT